MPHTLTFSKLRCNEIPLALALPATDTKGQYLTDSELQTRRLRPSRSSTISYHLLLTAQIQLLFSLCHHIIRYSTTRVHQYTQHAEFSSNNRQRFGHSSTTTLFSNKERRLQFDSIPPFSPMYYILDTPHPVCKSLFVMCASSWLSARRWWLALLSYVACVGVVRLLSEQSGNKRSV